VIISDLDIRTFYVAFHCAELKAGVFINDSHFNPRLMVEALEWSPPKGRGREKEKESGEREKEKERGWERRGERDG